MQSEPLWQRFHSLRHQELELEEALESAWKSSGNVSIDVGVRKHILESLITLQEGIARLQQSLETPKFIRTAHPAVHVRAAASRLKATAKQFAPHQLQHSLDLLAARAKLLESEVRDADATEALTEVHRTIQELRAPAKKKLSRLVPALAPTPTTVWDAAALALHDIKARLKKPVTADTRTAALSELQSHQETLIGHLSILRLSSAPIAQRLREQTSIAAVLHTIEDMRHALHDNRPLPTLRHLPSPITEPILTTKTTRSRKRRALVTQSPVPAFSFRRMFGGLMGFLDAEI